VWLVGVDTALFIVVHDSASYFTPPLPLQFEDDYVPEAFNLKTGHEGAAELQRVGDMAAI
jgi:hypothetical protein